jgi:FXSXX-COOH protein
MARRECSRRFIDVARGKRTRVACCRGGEGVGEVPGDAEDALVDVSGLSLRDVDKLGDSSLAHELRRLLLREEGDSEPISGFNDSV